jgi:hypothetical protein
VIAEDHGARRFTFQVPKDLGALAIEPFAENDIRGDRVLPPIAFNPAFVVDVTHDG